MQTRKTRTPMKTGDKYNQLTAICKVDNGGVGYTKWQFKCDCGKIVVRIAGNVKYGMTKSCGCKRNPGNRKHKMTGSPEYYAWTAAKSRCSNRNNPRYWTAGGRGINMCKEWCNSFETFYADMGPRPTPQHHLARIDKALDYSKENCHWLLLEKQTPVEKSTTDKATIMYKGKLHTLTGIAIALGCSVIAVRKWLYLGLTADEFDVYYRNGKFWKPAVIVSHQYDIDPADPKDFTDNYDLSKCVIVSKVIEGKVVTYKIVSRLNNNLYKAI